jgi:hypothetical protein
VDAPHYYLEHLRMAFIKLANPEKLRSFLQIPLKFIKDAPAQAPVPSLRKTITETAALALNWFNSSVNRLTVSLEKNSG